MKPMKRPDCALVAVVILVGIPMMVWVGVGGTILYKSFWGEFADLRSVVMLRITAGTMLAGGIILPIWAVRYILKLEHP